MKTLKLGPDHRLKVEEVWEVAHENRKLSLSPLALRKVQASRRAVERMIQKRQVVYGVTTGFGKFKDQPVSSEDLLDLQKNLMRSHSVGVGDILPIDAVRASLLVRLNSLIRGHSGVRTELVELVAEMLNRDIVPVVPSQGSVGSSGDLAPLSHMGLVLMGEGMAWHKGKLMTGREALRAARLKPIQFEAKEGLAWNNGTSVMTGIGALALYRAQRLADLADGACALSLEALCGVSSAFSPKVHDLRPHPGQILSAKRILAMVHGSRLVDSMPNRIQDAYSIRCTPQVHGAVREAMRYVADVVERELNSVTDNPLIFSEPDQAISGGNFHGEPIAIAMDTLGIAVAELANISERRTAKLMDGSTNEGLPMFLISPDKGGLHSGLMMVQYTAAALVSENKVLAHPASVDSIPTSANQEDHVSMGTIAARKAADIIANTENVLSIELLSAAQALEFRKVDNLGSKTSLVFKEIRKASPSISEDRQFSKDINLIRESFSALGKIISN